MNSSAHSHDPAPDPGPPALIAEHLSKSFGGERALDDVTFTVLPGEVHGLLGHNGSGKSTLIKILSGFHHPDPGGRLTIHGKRVGLPLAAGEFRKHGLAFVHQQLGLVPDLTVLENFLVGNLASRITGFINWKEQRRRAREVFARFDLDIDPEARVAELTQAERALLAIVRAFEDIRAENDEHGTAGILFLDEPTPFLPRDGVDKLFSLVRGMASEGASVIFVSQDVDEMMAIIDRATILRDGRVAGILASKDATRDDLVSMIIGRRVEPFQAVTGDFGERVAAISIHGLRGGSDDQTLRKEGTPERRDEGISIALHEGEVVGLTGLIGSGFDEVPKLLFGASPASGGTLRIGDDHCPLADMSPAAAMARGIALLPAERLEAAGVGELTVADNVTLSVLDELRSRFWLDPRKLLQRARELGVRFDVRPNDPLMALESLSGGNQQKVLLAKWLQTRPTLLLLIEPTQGVDVGARQQVLAAIRAAADDGTAVLCASTDHEQLAQLCDRVLIFARGRIVRELGGEAITKDRIAEQTLSSFKENH